MNLPHAVRPGLLCLLLTSTAALQAPLPARSSLFAPALSLASPVERADGRSGRAGVGRFLCRLSLRGGDAGSSEEEGDVSEVETDDSVLDSDRLYSSSKSSMQRESERCIHNRDSTSEGESSFYSSHGSLHDSSYSSEYSKSAEEGALHLREGNVGEHCERGSKDECHTPSTHVPARTFTGVRGGGWLAVAASIGRRTLCQWSRFLADFGIGYYDNLAPWDPCAITDDCFRLVLYQRLSAVYVTTVCTFLARRLALCLAFFEISSVNVVIHYGCQLMMNWLLGSKPSAWIVHLSSCCVAAMRLLQFCHELVFSSFGLFFFLMKVYNLPLTPHSLLSLPTLFSHSPLSPLSVSVFYPPLLFYSPLSPSSVCFFLLVSMQL